MNWLPKITRIEFTRYYFNGIYSSTCTGTPGYYWYGYKYYNWLWFNWKRKLVQGKHFDVFFDELEIKDLALVGIECVITY